MRRLAAFLALAAALLIVVASALAADPNGGAPNEPAFHDPLIQEQIAAERARQERQEAERSAPQAEQRREDSEIAYADASDAEALDIAKGEFGEIVSEPLWRPLELEDGERIDAYLGNYTARVERDDGDAGLLESMLPLRARDDAGHRRLLDPELDEQGSHYEAENAIVETTLAKDAADGVAVDAANVSVRPADAPEGSDARTVENKLFYANVASDTDFIAAPVATGVATFLQLRSTDSPEDQQLRVDMPAGAKLRLSDDGGAEVTRGDAPLVTITPPAAWDADGQSMPVRYAVDGNQLTVEVAHRDGDFRYPILVDPVFESYSWSGLSSPGAYPGDTTSWTWTSNRSGDYFDKVFQNGLRTKNILLDARFNRTENPFEGSQSFNDGDFGEWLVSSFRESYIERIDFNNMDHEPNGANACTSVGLYDLNGFRWETGRAYNPANASFTSSPNSRCSGYLNESRHHWVGQQSQPDGAGGDAEGATGNVGVFALVMAGSGKRTSVAKNLLRGSLVYRYDRNDPTLTNPAPQSSDWSDDTQADGARKTHTLAASGRDPGLGMKYFNLFGPNVDSSANDGSPDVQTKTHPCTGDRRARCPVDWSQTLSYKLEEGRNELSLVPYDVLGQSSAGQSWTQRIDRSAPTLELSGSLFNRRGENLNQASYQLHVDARDGDRASKASERSGVKQVEVLVDGQAVNSSPAQACSEGSCSLTHDYEFRPDDFSVGQHQIEVRATDQLGHRAEQTFTVTTRRGGITVDIAHEGLPSGWFHAVTPTARVTATGGDGGIKRLGLDSPGSGWQGPSKTNNCGTDTTPHCPSDQTEPFVYNESGNQLPEGKTPVRAQATDNAGNSASKQWETRVDRRAPELELNGTLTQQQGQTLYAGVHLLGIHAEDGDEDLPQSGVRRISVYVDGASEPTYTKTQDCAEGSCAMDDLWPFVVSDYQAGEHTIEVEVRDGVAESPAAGEPPESQARHVTRSEPITVTVGDLSAPFLQDRIGLEEFYHYDSTETGANTRAHVNVGTGNLVWHSTPIANPGRGLSSFINLTYNSQERLTDYFSTTELLPYDDVGHGFSIGISGLTRINEPLDLTLAPAGVVRMTDPDGTEHVFRQNSDGVTFTPPPGVDLHLRRFAPLEVDLSAEEPAPFLISKKAWAITRPDGVTFYFDQRGYPTTIEDRNGNELTFEYEYRNILTRDVCDFVEDNPTPVDGIPEAGPVDDLVCRPQLKQLVDASGSEQGDPAERAKRAIKFSYQEVPLNSGTGLLPNRIDTITDHAGRVTDLDYNNLTGQLTKMTQSGRPGGPNAGQSRAFEFGYQPLTGSIDPAEPLKAQLPGDPDLASITDPRGNETRVEYSNFNIRGPEALAPTLKRVAAITDRAGHTSDYRYTSYIDDPNQLLDGYDETVVTDANDHDWTYHTDPRARLIRMFEPDADSEGERGAETDLTWDEGNNLRRIIDAAGSDDEAITTMDYNVNGLLTASTRAAETDDARRTEFEYRNSAGNQRTGRKPLLDPLGDSADNGKAFVSDLTSVTTPNGTATSDEDDYATRFEPDATTGNVEAMTDPEGFRVEMDYDARGQLERERPFNQGEDEAPDVTEYLDYDASGFPEKRRDPRDKLWTYDYDEVGNLVESSDPRHSDGAGCPNGDPDKYTTALSYDAFDRLTKEVTPKLSESCDFVTRTTQFDANDNVTATVDGNGARVERDYTAMDDVSETRSPETEHEGEDGESSEVTRFEYDPERNLVRQMRPRGVATPDAELDYTTDYRYDFVNNRTEELRRSATGGDVETLATSWAYDLRHNVIGLSDPRHNAADSQTAPAINATDPDRQRLAYEYDKADNRTAAIEDPGGLELRSQTEYDLNDNPIAEVDPRGSEGDDPNPGRYTSEYRYDGRDLLTDEIDAEGGRRHYGLRPDGNLAFEVSPRGTEGVALDAPESAYDHFRTDYAYDANGQLATRSLPRAPGQYTPARAKVEYERNDVGDPETITDARGHAFQNEFLDTGELSKTERPSWFKHEGDAIVERSPEEMGSAGEEPEVPRSEAEGNFGEVDAEEMPDWLPVAGTTRLGYDDELRLSSVEDAEGATSTMDRDALGRVTKTSRPLDAAEGDYIVERMSYDPHGNLRRFTDGDGHATVLDYDQLDRQVSEARPGSGGPDEVTRTSYDENDNVVSEQTPRGAAFTWRMGYDAIDRMTSERNPLGEETTYAYDAASNPIVERGPRGNVDGLSDAEREKFDTQTTYDALNQPTETRDGLGERTLFDYDADGNEIRVDEPGSRTGPGEELARHVTERSFDGRGLPWSETTGRGSEQRTTVTEFDANGNLRRTVKPRGVDESERLPEQRWDGTGDLAEATRDAEVRDYSDDDLLTTIHMAWGGGSDERWRQDFELDSRGRVCAIAAPYTGERRGGTAYTHYDTGWIRSSSDPKSVGSNCGRSEEDHVLDYEYDDRGNQTVWRSSKGGRRVKREYFPSGMLARRWAYKSASDSSPRSYTYEYNANRSRTRMVDEERDRTTNIFYDNAERETVVDETWQNGKDTVSAYDAGGNVVKRRTDGDVDGGGDPSDYAGGKTTMFEYDALDRETKTIVDPPGMDDNRTTETDYYPSGQRSERDKPNHVVESFFFNNDGRISLKRREKNGEELDTTQAYSYDRNGNRTKDERGTYEFNARDQLTKWVRDESLKKDGTVTYELNGAGAILEKTDSGAEGPNTTTYDYLGDRLESATVGGVTANYSYDDFGSLTRIAAGGEAATFSYDEFERMTGSHVPDEPDEGYSYDGLDRRDSKTKSGERFDLAYVGQSEAISQERSSSETRSYDYNSTLEGLGQEKDGDFRSYAKDANGSVEGLEDSGTGELGDDRYEYDPYGQIENEDDLTDVAEDNPFRFEGFYYDSGVKQYDMRARFYRPEVGRFTTQDRFESARGDFALQADPLTNNRYAFAGGNPVNNIEFDGHFPGYNDQPRSGPKGEPRPGAGHDYVKQGGSKPTGTNPNYNYSNPGSGSCCASSTGAGWNYAASGGAAKGTVASAPAGPPPSTQALRQLAAESAAGQCEALGDDCTPEFRRQRTEELLEWNQRSRELLDQSGLDPAQVDQAQIDGLQQSADLFNGRTPPLEEQLTGTAQLFAGGLEKGLLSKLGGPLARVGRSVGGKIFSKGPPKAARGTDDIARLGSDRQRRLGRLATAGTPEGRGVRNFDVPNPAAAAHDVTRSLTRGEGVRVTQPRPGVTVHGLPEGGHVVLRSPQASRSGLWAVDAYGVPGAPGAIRTHFRSRP